jgi:ketosteroid isomerase-like protein
MSSTRSSIHDIADRLFAAIETGDKDALAALWSDKVVVWRQGDRERDKLRALKVIEWFMSATTARRYDVLDREVFDTGFVQQHVLHAVTAAGATIALRVCMVIKVGSDGLITQINEYLDPADLGPLTI